MNATIAKPYRSPSSVRLDRGRRAALLASVVTTWVALVAPAAAHHAERTDTDRFATDEPATTTEPSRVGAGLFARTEYLSAPVAAFRRARFDLGLRLRPLEHLAIDVGIGIGGGRMRRPNGLDRATELGLSVDVVGYLNPRSIAQVFVLGGLGLGAMGSTEQVGTVDPECPSDSLFFGDLVLGAGLEVALNDTVSVVGSSRFVRRTAFLGELELSSGATNPPDQAMRSVLAVALDVRVIVALGAPPHPTR